MSTSASTRAAVLRALNFGNRFSLVYSDPPQPERPCGAPAERHILAGATIDNLSGYPLTVRLGHGVVLIEDAAPAPEPLSECCVSSAGCVHRRLVPAPAEPARVDPPEGVTVIIGWTEPTDDEPRSLPIVWGFDAQRGEWERRRLLAGARWLGARHVSCPQPDLPYVIRPVPSPPVPETERVPWWEAVQGKRPIKADNGNWLPPPWEIMAGNDDDGRVLISHDPDQPHDRVPGNVEPPAGGTVEVLPLDGTDGD
jgi:hypothetical protein